MKPAGQPIFKKIAIASTLLLTLVLPWLAAAAPARAVEEGSEDARYLQATGLFNQKQWPAALEAFKTFQKEFPSSRWRLAVKLRLADLEENPQTALAAYSQVLKQSADPEWKFLASWGLAQTYFTLGQYPSALDHYRQIAQINGSNKIKALTMAGLCLMALKQPKEARSCFEQAAAVNDLPASAWSEQALASIGDADLAALNPEGAMKAYDVYLKKHPEGNYREQALAGKAEAQKRTGRIASGERAAESPILASPLTEAKYALQVGAFTKIEYAKALEKKMRQKGYKAVVLKYVSGHETYHQVRIGSYRTREEAAQAGLRLEKKEKLGFLIVTQTAITPAASEKPRAQSR